MRHFILLCPFRSFNYYTFLPYMLLEGRRKLKFRISVKTKIKVYTWPGTTFLNKNITIFVICNMCKVEKVSDERAECNYNDYFLKYLLYLHILLNRWILILYFNCIIIFFYFFFNFVSVLSILTFSRESVFLVYILDGVIDWTLITLLSNHHYRVRSSEISTYEKIIFIVFFFLHENDSILHSKNKVKIVC